MKVLELEHLEAQFGLMIREKKNPDNYALIRFEDLDNYQDFSFHESSTQTELPDAPTPAPSSQSPLEEFISPVLVLFCINCHCLDFYQCVFVIIWYFISVTKCLGVPVKN
jgi:hypothetical protein